MMTVFIPLFMVIAGHPRRSQVINSDDFIFVKGGCYQMGDVFGDGVDLEQPVHEVCISDYYLAKYEVTQELYLAVMGLNPSSSQDNPKFPVDVVNYWNIENFLEKLNKR